MHLLKYEKLLWEKGISLVAGIDEAGRGPLAGPLVAAAVILDSTKILNSEVWSQIKDSKQLTPIKRQYLFDFICTESLCYSIVEVPEKVIDDLGIGKANNLAFKKCVRNLKLVPDHILTDFFKIKSWPEENQTNITKGDTLSISIAAASILAKVHRDFIMVKMHAKYPQYGFDKHKGYGTKQHREAILEYGLCEIHRKSFKIN